MARCVTQARPPARTAGSRWSTAASRTIQVDGTTNLTFGGQVTSPDDAGFTKTGTGTLTLSNGSNDFVGPLVVSAGLVATGTLADGGQASGIGAGSSDATSLVLQNGGGLEYTGATTSTDRGITLAAGSAWSPWTTRRPR